jgi:hypothetical protein
MSQSGPRRNGSGKRKCSPPSANNAKTAGHLGSVVLSPVSLARHSDFVSAIWDNVAGRLPHEGCGSKFVSYFHGAFDRIERADF